MAINPAEVRTVVEAGDDFAFEMKVASVLAEFSGVDVHHGETYTDSVSGKPRQFDFRVSFAREACRLFLAIECKRLSLESPLIVCGRARTDREAFHNLVKSTTKGTMNDVLVSGAFAEVLVAERRFSIYPSDEFTGKSLVRLELKTERKVERWVSAPDSDVYDKWAQALSSSADMVIAAASLAKGMPPTEHRRSAIMPIVAIPDGLLWKCEYDSNGNLREDPGLVDEATFYVGRSYVITGHEGRSCSFQISHLHFVTLSGLRAMLARSMGDPSWWACLFKL